MSELVQKNDRNAMHWQLLAGASTLVLVAYVSTGHSAKAAESDRPTVWIELGGQLNRLQDSQEVFAPPFVALTPPNFTPPQEAERPPLYGIDASGKISFQPNNSDWIFSASVRYGRASSAKHVRHQSYPDAYNAFFEAYGIYSGVFTYHVTGHNPVNPRAARFTDAVARESEGHTILDFQAGKDLGLGLFGRNSSSSVNAGVRFAQFTSRSRATLGENPDWQFKTHLATFTIHSYYYTRHISQQKVYQPYHSFVGTFEANRSFSGLGPSISWNSSVPVAGSSQAGELSFDWGVNAAILFGRQKTKSHHQTTARFHSTYANGYLTTLYQHPNTPDHTRSRNVVVPNIGGFAGLSFNYANAKVSFGYRADFFFGAMDGGIDARKTYDRGFYGPYATISIGLP